MSMTPPDWPTLAKRYGYPPDAVPERPWWRRDGLRWLRTDGLALLWPAEAEILGSRADRRGLLHPDEPIDHALARIDRAHPLPVPEPAVGQVWAWPEGEAMIGGIQASASPYGATGPRWVGDILLKLPSNFEPWPPPGAVLVSGPGSPWADTRE